jgi:3',5'-cyclic AMP phosphodiesterase CpdA
MARLAIISDLHFGTVPEGLAETLLDDLHAQSPDGVIVAGDLTQRARTREYEQAAAYLAELPGEVMVIPGNHDIPAWGPAERFLFPFKRYAARFGKPAVQYLTFDGCAVVGLNTAKSAQPHLQWQEGTVRRLQALQAAQHLAALPAETCRIVVSHHPLIKVPNMPRAVPARRAKKTVESLVAAGADVFVSGHTHLPFLFTLQAPLGDGDKPIMALGAPSALSNRLRGEPNGYWLLDADPGRISKELRSYLDGSYTETRPRDLPDDMLQGQFPDGKPGYS